MENEEWAMVNDGTVAALLLARVVALSGLHACGKNGDEFHALG
jgi:hypothetical protein